MAQTGVLLRRLQGIATIRSGANRAQMVTAALMAGEGLLTSSGAFAVTTGAYTGRSPKDKYIVRDALTDPHVWWENSGAMSTAQFDRLLEDMLVYATGRALYHEGLSAGADPAFRMAVSVVTETAWHALFIRNLLIRDPGEGAPMAATILHLPGFIADPGKHGTRTGTVIALDMSRNIVLIGGTHYAGEIKKSVFSLLNFHAPLQGVFPMHCSANVGPDGRTALFFGLSGTGKTTLSSDPARPLIGDDEHLWSGNGVANIEGGCYAKTANLSAAAEPEIFAATKRFGTVLENVVIDPETRLLDLDDNSLAENSRGSYPIDFIPNASKDNLGPVPKNIIFLTADAYGVLPPIARLTPDQAMYHFLSGYTARVAGTEIGVVEPEATFSTCFGAPFMPRHPTVYGNLLKERIAKGGVKCWLVNTGWSGGKATQEGIKRMPIKATRALLNAALDGSLNNAEFKEDPNFGFDVPVSVPGVDDKLLDARGSWADPAEYDKTAQELVSKFIENFEQFEAHVDEGVLKAAPKVTSIAA